MQIFVRCVILLWSLGAILSLHAQGGEAQPTPDPKTIRARIDAAVAQFSKEGRPATPGLIVECIGYALDYGVPAYNNGDPGACYRFYAQTANALLAAFKEERAATMAGRAALEVLDAALKSADAYQADDDRAWAVRFGFDRVTRAWQYDAAHAQALVGLGTENFYRGHYREAESAFRDVARQYAELQGADREQVSVSVRIGLLALSHALFAQGKFAESAKALAKGLEALPEWPTYQIDQHGFYRDPAHHDAALEKLKAAVANEPSDPALRLLLGHELYFTGRKDLATEQFRKLAELAPDYPGVNVFARMDPESKDQKRIAALIQDLAAEAFEKREEAEQALRAQGRWALPALLKAIETSKDPEVQRRATEIVKPLVEGQ